MIFNHRSSSALNSDGVGRDFTAEGTMLYRAGPTEEKELKNTVLVLLYFDFPMGLQHVVPLRSVALKWREATFGISWFSIFQTKIMINRSLLL